MKVLCIFGTRPEAIKMISLIRRLRNNAIFDVVICSTGQHKEMLDEVLTLFDIIPDYNLNVMKVGQSIIELSNKILSKINDVIKIEKPDLVLVHGDTTTTLNGALAAFYNQIPIGHIEAGLRSDNIYSPFPEEMNRKLTSHLVNFTLCSN